ncbi:unnamed protein product [Prunus brigantina]
MEPFIFCSMKAKVNFSDAETKGMEEDRGERRRARREEKREEEKSEERGEERGEKNLRGGCLVSQRREKRRAWKSLGF